MKEMLESVAWLCKPGGANPGFSPDLLVTMTFLRTDRLPREGRGAVGDRYYIKLLKEIKCHSFGVPSLKGDLQKKERNRKTDREKVPQQLVFELHLTFFRTFHHAQARNLVNLYSSACMNPPYQPS